MSRHSLKYRQKADGDADGEGWIKLRNDDFSDLSEHYRPRGTRGDASLPEISDNLMATIRGMMTSRPEARWTLKEIQRGRVMRRLLGMAQGGEAMSEALVEESEGFLSAILSG